MDDLKELTDEEIIMRVRTSNQDLYAVIIDRYQKKLVRYVNNLIKNEDKAIDIVQESFIKAYIKVKKKTLPLFSIQLL
jgi:RNA polymerase sigma-70 factor (ECF subfamily)